MVLIALLVGVIGTGLFMSGQDRALNWTDDGVADLMRLVGALLLIAAGVLGYMA